MPVAPILLVLGQSNGMTYSTINPSAVAYNTAAAPTNQPFDEWTADAGIQVWNCAGSPPAWQQYAPGAGSDGDGGNAWGPEASFAQLWRAVTGVPLYIYKQCPGGVGLQQQAAGTDDWSPLSVGKEWDILYSSFGAGCAALSGYQCVVPAILWLGGETDTGLMAAAQNYRENLELLDQSMRDRLGIANFRMIVNRVRFEPPNGPWSGLVRDAQVRFAEADPRRAWVDSDTLAFGNVSPGHYDPPAVVALGRKMFGAYSRP